MSPPHSQDPGVEIQADFGILDPHHRLLHDEVLATLVRLGQPRLVVLARNINFHLAFSHRSLYDEYWQVSGDPPKLT